MREEPRGGDTPNNTSTIHVPHRLLKLLTDRFVRRRLRRADYARASRWWWAHQAAWPTTSTRQKHGVSTTAGGSTHSDLGASWIPVGAEIAASGSTRHPRRNFGLTEPSVSCRRNVFLSPGPVWPFRLLVLDEADRLLELGFKQTLEKARNGCCCGVYALRVGCG